MSAYDNKYWSHRIAQLAEKVPETDDLSFFSSEAYRDFTEPVSYTHLRAHET